MLYVQLSLLFFLQYAIYGAWCPVLAARLLGPLKMSGKQTGWIYATLPLASLISPMIAGQLADQFIDPKWLMVIAHVAGGIFLIVAAKQQKFWPLFAVMFLFSLFFGATLALANAIVLGNADSKSAPMIFIWAPIAWAAIGYALSGWRSTRKTEGDGSDCLWLAAGLSLLMAVVCVFQPTTEPQGGGQAALKALSMVKDFSFLAFVVAQFIGAAIMQFYFLGTAQFMQDNGIQSKYVPGAMAIAQVAQAVATFFLLGWLYTEIGATGTIAIGAGCWLVLFVIYVALANRGIIAASQVFHGLAYVFFINASWMYVADYADKSINASAQALIILVQNGIGLFLGTQIAGYVMDKNSVEGKFHWKKIFVVPVACMAVAIVLLLGFVKNPQEKDAAPKEPESAAQETALLPAPSGPPNSAGFSA